MVIDYCTRSEPALNARETKRTVWQGPAPARGSPRLPAPRRSPAHPRTAGEAARSGAAKWLNARRAGGPCPALRARGAPRSGRRSVRRAGVSALPSPSPTVSFRQLSARHVLQRCLGCAVGAQAGNGDGLWKQTLYMCIYM